jgi:hypothetical protein
MSHHRLGKPLHRTRGYPTRATGGLTEPEPSSICARIADETPRLPALDLQGHPIEPRYIGSHHALKPP